MASGGASADVAGKDNNVRGRTALALIGATSALGPEDALALSFGLLVVKVRKLELQRRPPLSGCYNRCTRPEILNKFGAQGWEITGLAASATANDPRKS